jgi:Xaa-Pro aminopeptidase
MVYNWTARRKKVGEAMELNDVAIIFANSLPTYPRPFLQDKNFYYLCGLEIPNAILVLKKSKEKILEYLFIERNIPERIVWDGKK